ncbi:MAG TPA: DUF6629 family protein [Methylocystis sp.]|nr:DUF6629 family protein [Methylocystis sp.]
MCFSAAASFSAGAFCVVIGSKSLLRAQRSDLALAAIPIIFGVHQSLEGLVWLSRGEGLGQLAGYVFAFIAFCLWPVYVPVASWLSETESWRRRLVELVGGLGFGISLFAAQVLWWGLVIDPSGAQVRYLPTTSYREIYDYYYALCTIGPLLLHRSPPIKVFGGLVLLFFCVTLLYLDQARYSVWCFFAALCSGATAIHVAAKAADLGAPPFSNAAARRDEAGGASSQGSLL